MADAWTKAPGERVLLTFDFAPDLPDGATLTAATEDVVLHSVKKGSDDGSSLVFSSIQIDELQVKCLFEGGVHKSQYWLRAEAEDSAGELRYVDKVIAVAETAALVD